MNTIRVVILTVSDQGYAGTREDKSGPALREALGALDCQVVRTMVLPDERAVLSAFFKKCADEMNVDLVLTTGGTGLAPRDVTPEATLDVAARTIPGIAEAIRSESRKHTARAALSRGVAVQRGKTLIVNLPGSPKAVRECMEVLLPILPHAVETMRGEASECADERTAEKLPVVDAGHRTVDARAEAARRFHFHRLTHLDKNGAAHMVDVEEKTVTDREAAAQSVVTMQPETLSAILAGNIKKGDVFSCARIAGILAAKRTHELIPLCHPIPLTGIQVELVPRGDRQVVITATLRCSYKTGVEMEALTAASVAALTLYDMCKAIDRGMVIEQTCLLHKSGGKSGEYTRGEGTENANGI